MKYVNVNDLSKLLDERELRSELSNTSLPVKLTDNVLRPLGYACVPAPTVPQGAVFDESNTFVFEVKYDPVEDKYYRDLVPFTVPTELAEIRLRRKSKEVRDERDRLLADTDWIIIKSVETGEDVSDWKQYRQTLRDIPLQPEFPFMTTFPPKPV